MAKAQRLYGPAHQKDFSEAMEERMFRRRVASANKKLHRKSTLPLRSKAKKWTEYYSEGGENASFRFFHCVDPKKLSDVMTKLQRMGVSGGRIEMVGCRAFQRGGTWWEGLEKRRNYGCPVCAEAEAYLRPEVWADSVTAT